MGTWAAVTLGLAVAAAVQGQASMPRLLPDLEAFSGGAAQVGAIGQGGLLKRHGSRMPLSMLLAATQRGSCWEHSPCCSHGMLNPCAMTCRLPLRLWQSFPSWPPRIHAR